MTYYITAGYGSNGTMTPSGIVAVAGGSNQTFLIYASSGYHIDSLTVDGNVIVSLKNHVATYNYTFYGVYSDHVIQVTFSKNHIVAISCSAGGSTSPSGDVSVDPAGSLTITFYPAPHRWVDYYTINGSKTTFHSQDSGPLNVTVYPSVPITLYVHFTTRLAYIRSRISDVVTVAPVIGDFLSVEEGTDQTFSFSVKSGWTLTDIIINRYTHLGPVSEYTFSDISGETNRVEFVCTFDGAANATMSGQGTAADPYVILDREDLQSITTDVTTVGVSQEYDTLLSEWKYYVLGKDIDLAGEDWIPIGWLSGHAPEDYYSDVGYFAGYLDGAGHTIKNMTIDLTTYAPTDYVFLVALFAGFDHAEISNLHLCRATIDAGDAETDSLALLAGEVNDCIITGCSVSGEIHIGTNACWESGGITAYSSGNVLMENCRADLKCSIHSVGVPATDHGWCDVELMAGLIGYVNSALDMDSCQATLTVSGEMLPGSDVGSGILDVGPLIGYLRDSEEYLISIVWNCRGTINFNVEVDPLCYCSYIGGAIGGTFIYYAGSDLIIDTCWASGKITLNYPAWTIGGFVGGLGGYARLPQQGYLPRGYLSRCLSSTDIVLELGDTNDMNNECTQIGGFAGSSAAAGALYEIRDCACIGDIIATAAEGIDPSLTTIGMFSGTDVSMVNCYYAGVFNIPASIVQQGDAVNFNGFVGYYDPDDAQPVTSCYWDTEVSGITVSAVAEGKTTAQMKLAATYVGWDFTSEDYPRWRISEGSYPMPYNEFVTIANVCERPSNAIWFQGTL